MWWWELLLLSFRFHSNLKKLTCISCTVGLYFLPAQCSNIVQLLLTLSLPELLPPALQPVRRRLPSRDEIISHRFKVSFYSYGWISEQELHTPPIRFVFRLYRNFHRDARRRAQKQLIWEEAQQNSRRPKKPLENTAFTTQQPFPYFI